MTTYDFTLILSGPTELTDDLADKLFAAGCDDATPSSSEGTVSVDFGREATDLESAIRSALENVSAAGYLVSRVEIDAEAPVLKTRRSYRGDMTSIRVSWDARSFYLTDKGLTTSSINDR